MVVCVLCKDEVPVRFWLGPHSFSVERPDVHREGGGSSILPRSTASFLENYAVRGTKRYI